MFVKGGLVVTATGTQLVDDYSLEMTGKDVEKLREAAPAIPPGTRVNVTFLGNEELAMRVNAAKVVRELGFVPVPHISARRLKSPAELEDFLGELQQVGASERVFVVAGDPKEPEGPYADSLSVIDTGILPNYGVTEVGIAGYPEGHPDIATNDLWSHMEAKTQSLKAQGLDRVVLTQFAFDADRVCTWIRETREHGIDSLIRIGTPGPAGIKRLLGYAGRFGVGTSASIVKKYGFSLTNLLGTAGPDRFLTELAGEIDDPSRNDGPHRSNIKVHFYTFGGLLNTAQWVSDFSPGL